MNKNKTPKPNLPVVKCYPPEVDMILKFFAISDTVDDALEMPEFKRRLDAIPQATSGLKMISGRMLQLVYDLVATLPEAKKKSILRMAPHMKFKVYHAAPASEVGEGTTVVETEDLDTLARYAKMNCDMCFDGNCNNCKLGKVFDKVMTYDRDYHEKWSTWSGWSKKLGELK